MGNNAVKVDANRWNSGIEGPRTLPSSSDYHCFVTADLIFNPLFSRNVFYNRILWKRSGEKNRGKKR